MGQLYKTVNLVQEMKKQAMIDELVKMGIIKNPAALEGKDYHDIKQLLAAALVKIESPENEWF
ncbi:hypothetical protein [Caldibacillus debilis]|uniref:hypothetical protein n=1 Tax=Caldibacillus debilis TaxID=301148 RepID=UPI000E36A798|nr:hypothetical protein [Caldibacillus debilis]REJ29267.1 MAG: hypothetical protein C6W56_05930 [Caldibacillus debilis]